MKKKIRKAHFKRLKNIDVLKVIKGILEIFSSALPN